MCPPCSGRWASHRAIPLTALGPGMGQDSLVCRSVNNSCRKALPHREGGSRPTSTSRESEGTSMMDVCRHHMHKCATYRSCTDPWWHHADATSRPTVLLITQLMPFLVLTNSRQKTNHGELKLAWAYRQRECRGAREQNYGCLYGSSSHTTWWTPWGLGTRRT